MKLRLDKRLLFFFSYRGACRVLALCLFGLVFMFSEPGAQAQANATNSLGFNLQLPDDPKEFDLSIRIVIFFTLLAIAPSLMIMMTCFTRIVIVMRIVPPVVGKTMIVCLLGKPTTIAPVCGGV